MYGARGSTAHLTGGGSGRSMAPLVMACAPAEAPALPGLSGLAWLTSLSWPRFCLVLLGYVTAGAVTFWPVLNTFMGACQMQAVGRGTRGEPFVLSLLSYTCTLYLSLMSNGWHLDESVWINGLGALFYMVYLVLFLLLADDDHRRTTLSTWVVAGAVVYLGLVAGIGVATESTDAVQWMCTLVALAATCVPLALAYFVMEWYVENLPDCLSSSVGLLYSMVWLALGIVPQPDFHAVVQNVAGIICSVTFLVLLKQWPSNPAAGGAQGDALPDQHAIHLPAAGEALEDPLLQQHQVPEGANQQLAGVPLGANPPFVADLVADVPQDADQQLAGVQQGVNPPLVADLQLAGVPQGANRPLVNNLPDAILQGGNQQLAAVPQDPNPLPGLVDPAVVDHQVAIPPPAAV